MYLDTFETIHFHFLQIPSFQTFDNPYQALIGTGNILRWVIAMFGFLLSWRENFTVFWNNRRLIGSCLYLLVLARGLFLRRLPPLVVIWFTRVLLSIFGHKSPEFAILKEQPSEKGCRTYTEYWCCYNQHSNIVHCPLSLSHLTGRKANKQCNPKNGISFPQGPSHHRWSKRTLGCHFNSYQLLSIKFSKSTSPHRRSRRARVVVRNHINY